MVTVFESPLFNKMIAQIFQWLELKWFLLFFFSSSWSCENMSVIVEGNTVGPVREEVPYRHEHRERGVGKTSCRWNHGSGTRICLTSACLSVCFTPPWCYSYSKPHSTLSSLALIRFLPLNLFWFSRLARFRRSSLRLQKWGSLLWLPFCQKPFEIWIKMSGFWMVLCWQPQDKHNLYCQGVARLKGQSSIGCRFGRGT